MSGITVLVDQDGPLAGFDEAFYALCAANHWPMHDGAVHADALCPDHRFATDCLTDGYHRTLARRHVDTSDWFRELPVTPGAVEGLHRLAAHPEVEEVWICTKPLEANPRCRDSKAAWLVEHFGKDWERRLILTPDKSMVRGHILLDDAPKHTWFPRASWQPVIFPMSWNKPGSRFSVKGALDDLPRWDWTQPVDCLLDDIGAP